jgi:predicted unusual protein kinase regulating ubiquinone biosynthesis (AarF/ABC1/UbiB family)
VSHNAPARQSKVPTSRIGRLFSFGMLAGELATGGLIEGVRRLANAGPADTASAFLNPRNAHKLAQRLSHMRGAAMKLGQLLSLHGEDLVPPEFSQALALLRAGANPMPATQLKRLLSREYGNAWQQRFSEFDTTPLAAASIGQVHRARTSDGRDLALKIQYPGVARSIDSDVDNVAVLLRLLNVLPVELDVSGLIGEAKRQLHQEADYLQEARFLAHFRQLVADEPNLLVPRVHDDLTTRHILAMDFVTGIPLEALCEPDISQDQRDAAGEMIEHLLFRELFEFRFMQTDPNFANYLFQPETGKIVLLDFGSVREFSHDFVAHYARISRAIVDGDRDAVKAAAIDIGYLSPADPEDRIQGAIDLMTLICEPLLHRGPYDFATSRLSLRASELGFDLAFRRGYMRAPPPATVFLHRKLVGSFLICSRIRARVDVRSLILPFLKEI